MMHPLGRLGRTPAVLFLCLLLLLLGMARPTPAAAAGIAPVDALRRAQAELGRRVDIGWCQRFVERMYGVSTGFVSAAAAAVQVVTHPHDRSAPAGALVYFRADHSNGYWGHVGISEGTSDGAFVSATTNGVERRTLQEPYWSSLFLGWGAMTAFAQTPPGTPPTDATSTPTPPPGDGGPPGGPRQDESWAGWLAERFVQGIEGMLSGWWQRLTGDLQHSVADLLASARLLWSTPAELTYALAPVQDVTAISRGIGLRLLVLVVMACGLRIYAGSLVLLPWVSAAELLPRCAFAAMLLLVGDPLLRAYQETINAFAWAVGSAGSVPIDSVLSVPITGAIGVTLGLVALLLLLVPLFVWNLKRIVWVILCWLTWPLAAVCAILPQTQWVTYAWCRAFYGNTLVTIAMALGLKAAALLVASASLGTYGVPAPLVTLGLGLVAAWLCLEIPRHVDGAYTTMGRPPMGAATRLLGGLLGGPAGAGAAAVAAGVGASVVVRQPGWTAAPAPAASVREVPRVLPLLPPPPPLAAMQ